MNLTLPGRRQEPKQRKHRAASPAELREENRLLLNRQAAADDFFALLMDDRDQVYACWQKAAADRDAAEQLAACLAEENLHLRARLASFEAAEANATAVTVPPMVRDTSAFEDQATEPFCVKTLQAALGTAVTNPGQTGWGARNQQTGVA
ncbi:hypothetical protein [Streptomyces flavidovirens]|uniref:hypothetical protein n=1 Tax=Streptomyces flavidovirens TaxID=67298 RepID=UPI0036AA00D2